MVLRSPVYRVKHVEILKGDVVTNLMPMPRNFRHGSRYSM